MRRSSRALASCLVALAGLAMPAAATDGPAVTAPRAGEVAPSRFGVKPPDMAYGAFQRGQYLTALRLALPRAEAGEASAQVLVAEIYARGLGIARDGATAARWYEAAAEQGMPEAQFQTALLLLSGEYLEADPERAFTLMQAAADTGNRMAQFNLAQMILERDASAEAQARAVGYLEQAANAGLADAQYAMSQVTAQGVGGIEPDRERARVWLLQAARQNHDTAQVELGTWLVEGTGGTRDMEAGFAWIRAAAETGNVAARNRLAKLYRAGLGVEGNSVTAAAWYMLARKAGLVDPEMEDHLDGLTDEQIAEATRLTATLE